MPSGHGKAGSITVGGSAVGKVTEWTLAKATPLADATGMGDTGRSYVAGIPDDTLTCSCIFNEDDAPQATVRPGASLTAVLYPHGTTATYSKFSGTAVVESVEITGTLDDMVRMNVTAKGVMTEGVA